MQFLKVFLATLFVLRGDCSPAGNSDIDAKAKNFFNQFMNLMSFSKRSPYENRVPF